MDLLFVGIVTVGNLVRYSRSSLDIQSLGRVVNVAYTNFTIKLFNQLLVYVMVLFQRHQRQFKI